MLIHNCEIFNINYITNFRGRCGRDRMVVGLKLPMQSVPITINVVRSNPTRARCSRYSIMG